MARTFYPVDVTDITPSKSASWQDIDVSSYIPSGATGAIVRWSNTNNAATSDLGFRKKGSTDNRTNKRLSGGNQGWVVVGVDSNRVFQVYTNSNLPTYPHIYLHGYTVSGVTLNTNAPSISLSSTGSWETVDLSASCPSATGVIVEVEGDTGMEYFGVRMNGSSDEFYREISGANCVQIIVGCDSSQNIEIKRGTNLINCYIAGYISDGVNFNTDYDDVSITATGSWEDISETFSYMAIIRIDSSGVGFDLRKNGTTPDAAYKGSVMCTALVESDSSGIVEGKRETTDMKFYIVGTMETPDIRTPISDIVFSVLTLGQTEDRTITVHNDGDLDLTISDISATSGDTDNFTLVSPSTPFTISANSSQDVVIRYSP